MKRPAGLAGLGFVLRLKVSGKENYAKVWAFAEMTHHLPW
jgi:hypothetical protein